MTDFTEAPPDVAGFQLLPPDEGATPWLSEAEVPVIGEGEIGRAKVYPKDGALMADITFNGDFEGPIPSDFHVNGKIIRDSFYKDVRTIEEIQILSVGVTR